MGHNKKAGTKSQFNIKKFKKKTIFLNDNLSSLHTFADICKTFIC